MPCHDCSPFVTTHMPPGMTLFTTILYTLPWEMEGIQPDIPPPSTASTQAPAATPMTHRRTFRRSVQLDMPPLYLVVVTLCRPGYIYSSPPRPARATTTLHVRHAIGSKAPLGCPTPLLPQLICHYILPTYTPLHAPPLCTAAVYLPFTNAAHLR